MKHYKKAAALAICLLTAFSAAAPAMSVYADNEDETSISETAEAAEEDTEEPTEEEIIESGNFKYKVDEDGNAHIVASFTEEEELEVPDAIDGITVTEIERDAFDQLNVRKITIPASVEYISAENPFLTCIKLTEIAVDAANKNYTTEDGVLYSKDMKTLYAVPMGKDVSGFTVKEGVENIGIAAFYQTNLTSIVLPASVKSIERHSFSYCEKLTSVDMSKTDIEEIPAMAFVASSQLSDVKFSENTYIIEIAAFMDCTGLENIDLPPYLETVSQKAFQNTGLTKVVIPDSVTKIGYSAFGYNDKDVADDSFTIIGSYGSMAYKYCTDKDTDYDYENNFNFMTVDAYNKQLEFEAMNVQEDGDYMYAVIDGEACLTNCTAFDEVCEVPEELGGYKVTSIYYEAFQSCGSTEIILPETVKKIGELAFSQYVEKLTIPGGCTEIEGEEPFISCLSLKSITVTEGDGEFSSENGVLYNKDKSVLVAYPQAKEDTLFTVPSSVKEIADSGCCYNNYLEEVDLSSVEKIGNYAFEGCQGLTKAKLSKNLKEVGHNAFLGCSAMNSIRVYNAVETIGDYAFGFDYSEELAAQIEANKEDLAAAGETNVMPYSSIEGFKMYVDEDSLAFRYAMAYNINIITGTVAVGEKNVDKNFLWAVGGAAVALVVIVCIVLGVKSSKKKKAEKSSKDKKKKKGGSSK